MSGQDNDRAPSSGGKRPPPRNAGLTEQIIVDAALAVAARKGIDRLTMRDLAAELGVTQMAAYYHLQGKDDLLTRVANAVLSRIPDAGQVEGTWEWRVDAEATASLAELKRWPGISRVLARIDPPPHAVRLSEGLVGALRDAGFDDEEAVMAASLIGTWELGAVTFHEGSGRRRAHPLSPSRSEDQSGPSTEDFERFALRVIIEGLRAHLASKQR